MRHTLEYEREWRRQHPQAMRDSHERHRHGFTNDELPEVRKRRQGPCDICGKPEWRVRDGKVLPLSIDHDHAVCNHPNRNTTCKKCRRGFLCHDCNVGLGKFRDRPDLLRRAAHYLDGDAT